MSTSAPSVTTDRAGDIALVENFRPRVCGKFIFVGDNKFLVKGVTYGTFRSGRNGSQCYNEEIVERDFALISANGMNAIRTYTVPPIWLLDAALRHGLRVMVGVPWEQHMTFLDNKRLANGIEEKVREGVRSCARHPAVLCYAIGNEIPAPIVRWHGRARVERFLARLYKTAKREDPDALVTYVNYPSTEYLQLPFLDFVSFNVYLESQNTLERYLARLQNIAGERPLILAEVGLDSRRNGETTQAHVLDWQIRAAFTSGCAGTFVFAWTDEWFRSGREIEDWDFGLTRRNRDPKPALATVRDSFLEAPMQFNGQAPRISVVVCAYNAQCTIGETLRGLENLRYPNFEVIVVDDGSTDATAAIAAHCKARVIRANRRGLSAARNIGLKLATGDIIAYIDADAYPDPDWLTYLASTFLSSNCAAVGGPNVQPPGDGWIAECIANAPGNPNHVLVSDLEAEHIPGCNMAIRKSRLAEIGGFDPQFGCAGDDVDLCWRIHQKGWTIGFNPAAMVLHHRRKSLRGYWIQQKGYGRAEGLLEKKWPEKYDRQGQHQWEGRLYGKGHTRPLSFSKWRIYHGTWGTGLFQSIYAPAPGMMLSLPLMPEWYYVNAALTGLLALGHFWKPLVWTLPLLIIAFAVQLLQAAQGAAHAHFSDYPGSRILHTEMRIIVALLHLMQPVARLVGHIQHGLTPWRRRGAATFSFPRRRTFTHWHERWQAPEAILQSLESHLRSMGPAVIRGGDYDPWDLEVRVGSTGAVRVQMVIEEHGAGKQMVRFRCWPVSSYTRIFVTLALAAVAVLAILNGAWVASAIIATAGILSWLIAIADCGAATSLVERCLRSNDIKTR